MTLSLRLLVLAALASALAACGSEDTCFTERDCANGFRCEITRAGDEGQCVQCGAAEIPYNGADDDCDPATRDLDLDRDGDNAASSTIQPGGDCDDNDPTVNSKLPEACSDGKDNNCNGTVDEPECADVAVPQVRIESPAANSVHAGTVTFTVFADDDYQVASVTLAQGTRQYTQSGSAGKEYYFDVDTTQLLPDGPYLFQASATDTQGRNATDAVTIRVDNVSPPELEVDTPVAASSYAGALYILARATDGSGIRTLSASIDGNLVAEAMAGILDAQVDTSSLAEGAHLFSVRAEDNVGNEISETFSIFIDRTGPGILFSPLQGTELSGPAPVTITGTDTAGIREIQCEGQVSNLNPTDCIVDTLFLPNGPYVVTATVYDATIIDGVVTGNRSVSQISYEIYNETNRPPVLRFRDPQDGDGVYKLTNIFADAFSPNGLDRVELYVDGELAAQLNAGPYDFTWDFTRETGTVELELVAYDTAANRTSTTATVLVVPPPRLRLAEEIRMPVGGTNEAYLFAEVTGDAYLDLILTTPTLEVHAGTETPMVFDVPTSVGPAAKDVRTVDLDADNDPDLVVFTGRGIALYFNDGSGVFTAGPVYNPTIAALSVFDVGDLDGDGRVDVVFGHAAAGIADFIVMKQTASGQFVQTGTFGLVGQVTSIQIGAADDDADQDVLVGRVRTTFVTVFLNGGTGNFGAGQDSATFGFPRYARLAEITGDNYPDIVVTALGGTDGYIEVLAGSSGSPGQFSPVERVKLLDNPNGFALGDWTGDNLLDLVVTLPVGNQVQVHENVGGSFGPKRNYAIARDITRPSIVDMDADGLPDLVVQSPTRTTMAIARNRGSAAAPWRFGAAPVIPIDFVQNIRACPYGPYDPQRLPGALALGELSGSPLVDLVFAVDGVPCDENPFDPMEEVLPIPPAVLVMENLDLGDFASVSQTDIGDEMDPSALAVGDLDGQLGLDIGVGTRKPFDPGDPEPLPTAALLINDGPASYTRRDLFINVPQSVVIGDVNADGDGEAVFSEDGFPGGLIVFQGSGAFLYGNRVGFGASSVVIGNLDADPNNYLDMAVANSESDNVSVHLWNQATGRWRRSIYNTNASISALTSALLPGDDRPDLIGVGESGVIVLESDPNFGFKTPAAWNGGTPSAPYRINTGDFNRDGLLDVVVLNGAQDAVALLVGRPQGGFFRPDPIPVTRSPQALELGRVWTAVDDLVLINNVVPGMIFILNETN